MDWQRVATFVRERRLRLGLPQGAGDVSPATWGKIENVKETRYKHRTLVAICKALGWTADSIDRVGRGEEPLLLADVEHELRRLAYVVTPTPRPVGAAGLDPMVMDIADTTATILAGLQDLTLRVDQLERSIEMLIGDADETTKLLREVRAFRADLDAEDPPVAPAARRAPGPDDPSGSR